MSGLFGGGQSTHTYADKLAGIQLMTSTYGNPITVAYGTPRVTAKLVYYNDFTAIPHTTTQHVGKGGGSTMSNTTYTYTAAVILLLAEGEADGITKAWADKDRTDEPASLGFSFFRGTPTQSPWGYLTSKHRDDAVGYGGMAYVAHATADLGENGSLKNYSFELATRFRDAGDGLDALVSTVVQDALTHPRYGMGWSAAGINGASMANFSAYCAAAGIGISPVFDTQRPAVQWLEDLLKVGNCAAFPSQGALKFVPLQDTPVNGWTPDTAPIYDLGMGDYIVEPGEFPVRVVRSTQADAYNRVQIEWRNRAKDHAVEVAEASDQANVEAYGLRGADSVQLHMVTDPNVARDTAQRMLQRVLYVRNTYEFRLGPRHMLLEPVDLVTLTEPGLGLDKTPARIVSIEDNPDGTLDVVAEEWPFGVATATRYPAPSGSVTDADANADPGSVTQWQAFEVPGTLTEGRVEVWVGARGGTSWGGCEVWASRDGDTFSMVGTINAPARFGSLTATLPAATDTQGVDAANLNMTASGQFLPLSDADAAKYQGMCWLNGEILSYQDAALQSGGIYQLRKLRRALHGTPNTAHAPAEVLVRMDDALLHMNAEAWEVGSTIWLKLRSFNLVGGRKQDLATLPVQSYTVEGVVRRWPAPSNCAITIDANPNTGGNPGTGGTPPVLSGAIASIRYSTVSFPTSQAGVISSTGEPSLSKTGSRAAYYLFTLDSPGVVRVTMAAMDGTDTFVALWRADSTLVDSNDDSGGRVDVSEVYQGALPAGTYVVECTTYSLVDTCRFRLTLGVN